MVCKGSHVSQLLQELQFLSQLLHLSSHGELRIHRLQTLVTSQEHCKSNKKHQTEDDKPTAIYEGKQHCYKCVLSSEKKGWWLRTSKAAGVSARLMNQNSDQYVLNAAWQWQHYGTGLLCWWEMCPSQKKDDRWGKPPLGLDGTSEDIILKDRWGAQARLHMSPREDGGKQSPAVLVRFSRAMRSEQTESIRVRGRRNVSASRENTQSQLN